MIGFVLDDAALIAGLSTGTESQRRELSRLVQGAIDGGPHLSIPALCLAAAATVRPTIADHVAMLVTAMAPGSIGMRGLAGGQLAAIVGEFPGLGYPAAHAASEAMRDGAVIITTDADRYSDVSVSAIAL